MDRIIKKDTTELHVVVTSIKGNDISYRVYGKLKDSIYSIPKSAVFKIIFKDKQAHYFPKPTEYYADGTVKPNKFSPIYIDVAAGFMPDFSRFLADINFGYRFNEKEAIGISRINMYDYTVNASGVGIQYRLTSRRRSLLKLELGVITSASSIDRFGPEIYTHLRKNHLISIFGLERQ